MSALVIKNNSGLIEIARAGHMPFLHQSGNQTNTYIPKGIGIGLTNPETFDKNLESQQIELRDGDNIIMYSDGITELKNDKIELNIDYLKHFLKNQVYINKEVNIAYIIKDDILGISKENQHQDDMTVVSLHYSSKLKESL